MSGDGYAFCPSIDRPSAHGSMHARRLGTPPMRIRQAPQ